MVLLTASTILLLNISGVAMALTERDNIQSGDGEFANIVTNLENTRLDDVMELREVQNCGETGCKRSPCTAGTPPQKRYFHFTYMTRYTLSSACGDCPHNESECFNENCIPANGVRKSVLVANNQLPGPLIRACKGDTIVVDVKNSAIDLSVHWHGLTQEQTPYMDGVSFLTQCPIQFLSTFRYQFVAKDSGTHMWYTPTIADGFMGALIVDSSDDPWLHAGDEHVIILQTWKHVNAIDTFPGSNLRPTSQIPDSILINGRGQFCSPHVARSARSISDSSVDDSIDTCNTTPLSTFNVNGNTNYRLRIINGGFYECPLQFQIESHRMMLIAADGSPVTPVLDLKTIVIMPGERYDVVVSTNQATASYWIIVKAVGYCASSEIYQRGVLVYQGAENTYRSKPNPGYHAYALGSVLNPLNPECLGGSTVDYYGSNEVAADEPGVCAYKLESLERSNSHLTTHVLKLTLRFETALNGTLPVINGRSLVIPKSLVLGTSNILDEYPELKCSDVITTPQRCFHKFDIPLDSTLDITFINTDEVEKIQNSFHLHGYKFDLLYQGSSLDQSQDDKFLNLDCPSKRDTVVVPAGGVARIRFVASNPGMWLLQSMLIRRFKLEMGVILNVGTTDDLSPQPTNLPTCKKTNLLSVPTQGEILELISSQSSSSISSETSSRSD